MSRRECAHPHPATPIDTALSEIDDRMKNAISASTVVVS